MDLTIIHGLRDKSYPAAPLSIEPNELRGVDT